MYEKVITLFFHMFKNRNNIDNNENNEDANKVMLETENQFVYNSIQNDKTNNIYNNN